MYKVISFTPPVQSATALFTAAALCCSMPALGQVLAPEQIAAESGPKTSQWALGLGVGFDKSPLRDFDDKVQALPLVLYEGQRVSVFGTRVDWKLPSYGPLTFRLRARYVNDGYEADDSPYLTGMEERKGGVWLGAASTWRMGASNLAMEFLAATGDAEGKRFTLELNREFRRGALTVTPRITGSWYDDKFVDYYYGVRTSEARPGRVVHVGEAAGTLEAGVRFGYAIERRHNFFVDLSATGLGSKIKDSPLVERSVKSSVKLDYLYAF